MTVRYLTTLAMALSMLLALAGCATLGNDKADMMAVEQTENYRITGAVTYRERMALPAKSVVTVTLQDISMADRAATTLVEQTIPAGRHQVPIKFALDVDAARLQDNHRYAVRAVIRDVQGNLLWTTDTVHGIDPQQQGADLGALVLVRVTEG